MLRPDIMVRDDSGASLVFVEVKARRNIDEQWAAELRQNLVAHGVAAIPKFFMIVTSDRVFLWHEDDGRQGEPRLPDAQAPLDDLLGGTAETTQAGAGERLELAVLSWLSRMTQLDRPEALSEGGERFLIQSGLFDALRGASVEFEAA
jgi:hypothetical protein